MIGYIVQFLPRDAVRISAVFAVVRCPPVCPSVTFVYCIQMPQDIVRLLSRPGRPMILVFRLDALAKALSVIATATWLAGWLAGWLGGWVAGCHTPVLYQNGRTYPKTFLTI